MSTAENWRREPIEIAHSRNGKAVAVDYAEGLLRGSAIPWPPPELRQKLTKSGHERDFDGADREAARRVLGHYSDMQSLRSEDAVTWSVFGTMMYEGSATRDAFVADLLDMIGIPASGDGWGIWLWRRIPHPEDGGSRGPEIDFGIQGPGLMLLGEAKWGAEIDTQQGVNKDKSQLDLRREFFLRLGSDLLNRDSDSAVLTVSPEGGLQSEADEPIDHGTLYLRDTTWEEVTGLSSHPLSPELRDYIAWKRQYM